MGNIAVYNPHTAS